MLVGELVACDRHVEDWGDYVQAEVRDAGLGAAAAVLQGGVEFGGLEDLADRVD